MFTPSVPTGSAENTFKYSLHKSFSPHKYFVKVSIFNYSTDAFVRHNMYLFIENLKNHKTNLANTAACFKCGVNDLLPCIIRTKTKSYERKRFVTVINITHKELSGS